MGELLVLSEEETYLASTYADVAGRHVNVGTDMAVELVHESLAEAHHLSLALAAGREVGTALGTAHGQRGERVLEGLLEGEELQDTEVHRLVVAQTAFVRADGVVVLDAVAHVGLNLALVVGPGDAELDDSIGDAEALHEIVFLKFGVLVVLFFDGGEHLAHCLDVLRLIGESSFQILYYLCCVHNCLLLFLVYWIFLCLLFLQMRVQR